jgi:NADH-quinone oxidoreductase subunit A
LFIVFDVEVAFFFPWATVFGKATQLSDPKLAVVSAAASGGAELTPQAGGKLAELGVPRPAVPSPGAGLPENEAGLRASARRLALMALADISVFFGVLLVGFAYVWYRGDLDWVRAVGREVPAEPEEAEEPAGLLNV